ncbi:YraN family protein [Paenibacillus sp. NPDC057967]|uniref:YraN family protein n=1 Tax=Paenibacillus sp. NPDC057967 TaxID=3346293 RepID=UPI0036DB51AA
MSANRLRIGRIGEAEAKRRLELGGYVILAVNWRRRQGELDLVARDGERIVFVEVRSRSAASSGRYGTAAESVDPRKQRQVRMLAQKYMQLTNRHDAAMRFDVIAVTIGADDTIAEYRHYEAAF